MGPEVAQPPLVPVDLLAHPRQLPLHVEHVLQLAGPCRQQLDQPRLEPPRVSHARGDVGELLTHVLGVDVHGLELPERREPAESVVEAIGGDLHLEGRRAELAASRLHGRVGDVATDATREQPHLGDGPLEGIHFDARLAGPDHHV